MKYEETLSTSEQEKLRGQIRLLCRKMGVDNYERRQHLFGKMATIVEASISDPEQRKSIKDLVSNAIYADTHLDNHSYQFELFAEAQGFKLWNDEPHTLNMPTTAQNEYEKV